MKLALTLIVAFSVLFVEALMVVAEAVFDHYHPTVSHLVLAVAMGMIVAALGVPAIRRWWRGRNSKRQRRGTAGPDLVR